MRRNLARQAAARSWSVRELESRARMAGGSPTASDAKDSAPAPRAEADHPDRQAAIDQIADALGTALGADIKVRGAAHGYTAQLSFSSLDEALDLARRLSG
jgi:hypothetical protein